MARKSHRPVSAFISQVTGVTTKCALRIAVIFLSDVAVTVISLHPPPVAAEFICACVYSQCASTTSRGTVSSGKLTARRVREAVSSSSSSSLSRSAALWPMAAHRRHFLFHSGGDVTWEHIQKACLCYLTCSV